MLAYSTDPRYWLSNARRVKLARSANDGTYEFVGLPAGEYYVAAAADINQAQIDDTSLLEALTGVSLKVTVRDGERTALDVRLAGG